MIINSYQLNLPLTRLGVLQSDLVQFIPEFPVWKKEALYSFHMTTYMKIFMRFDHQFWGDWQVNKCIVYCLYLAVFMNGFFSFLPCLMFYFSLRCMQTIMARNLIADILFGKI